MSSVALDRSYLIHRWLGLILAVPLLLWCLSGLAYIWVPVAPQQPADIPVFDKNPVARESVQSLPADFLSAPDLERLTALAILQIDNEAHYQLSFMGERGYRYYRALDGALVADAWRLHAAAIAGGAAGEDTIDRERIHPVHPSIRHLRLPKAREQSVFAVPIGAERDLHRYVDTASGRLLGETTRSQRRLLSFIHYFHHMAWLGGEQAPLRWLLVAFGSFAIAVTGLAGLVLYAIVFRLKIRPSHPRRRWHRLLGLGLSLPLLAFGWSGFIKALERGSMHFDQLSLVDEVLQPSMAGPLLERFLRSAQTGPFTRLDSVTFDNGAFYRVFDVEPQGSTRIFNSATLARVPHGERSHAESLLRSALSLTHQDASYDYSLQRVEHFDPIYPSHHRVLPVWRAINSASGFTERFPLYHIDTLSNRLVHLSAHSQRRAQGRFENLHLFAYISDRVYRRSLLVLSAAGIALLAGLGIANVLLRRTKR